MTTNTTANIKAPAARVTAWTGAAPCPAISLTTRLAASSRPSSCPKSGWTGCSPVSIWPMMENEYDMNEYRRTNDYSVPVAYGHRDVLVCGYVQEVVISCGSEVIARHRRSYERDDFVFDPLHYLPLLEHKTGALDQAAPLVGWELTEEFAVLRRLLESRMGKRGKWRLCASSEGEPGATLSGSEGAI